MKQCPNCNTLVNDNVAFCTACGSPVGAAPQPAPQSYAPQGNVVAASRVVSAIKDVLSSPVCLIGIIAFTLSIFIALVTSFSTTDFGIIGELADEIGGDVEDFIDSMKAIMVLIIILVNIPGVLMAVGMWMNFAAASDKTSGNMKTSGLTFIKAGVIINLVGICILALVGLISSFAVMSEEAAAGAGALFVVAIVCSLLITYFALSLKTLSTVKSSALYGYPSNAVSGFVAVMCFISAVSNLISLFTGSWVSLFSIVAYVCFGVTIFMYKGRMTPLMYTQVPMGYAPQPQAAPYAAPNAYNNYNAPMNNNVPPVNNGGAPYNNNPNGMNG